MNRRGPRSVPTNLLLLRGSRRAKRPEEPQSGALPVAMPSELVSDPLAAEEWTRTVVPAIESGQLQVTDRALAIAHCVVWSQWRLQLAEARTKPMIVATGTKVRKLPDGSTETKGGHPIPNPAQGMANTSLKILKGLDELLGFSCTSRVRVHVPGGKRSKLEQFEERFVLPKRA